jgi:Uma2 family endonuclease
MVTIEDLKAFDGNRQIEVIDGEIVEHDRFATDNMQHIFIVKRLSRIIEPFVAEYQLGEAFNDDLIYVLEVLNGAVHRARIPDFSFIRKSSLTETHKALGPVLAPPTLAVEVTFPTQTVDDFFRRIHDYLEAGSEEVWFILSRAFEVYRFYRDDRSIAHIYRDGDTIIAENLFPGLEIPVNQLFDTGKPT